jgi:hypothetical protein
MFNVLLFNVVVLFVRLILEYCDLFSTMYVIYECKYISISISISYFVCIIDCSRPNRPHKQYNHKPYFTMFYQES